MENIGGTFIILGGGILLAFIGTVIQFLMKGDKAKWF